MGKKRRQREEQQRLEEEEKRQEQSQNEQLAIDPSLPGGNDDDSSQGKRKDIAVGSIDDAIDPSLEEPPRQRLKHDHIKKPSTQTSSPTSSTSRNNGVPTLFATATTNAPQEPNSTPAFLDFHVNTDFLNLEPNSVPAPDNDAFMRALQFPDSNRTTVTSGPSSSSGGGHVQAPILPAEITGQDGAGNNNRQDRQANKVNISASSQEGSRLPDGDGIVNGEIVDSIRLLSCKWYSSSKLNKMARENGLQYKKGKFSKTETDAIHRTLEDYKAQYELDDDGLRKKIFAKGVEERNDGNFWRTIALSTPGRPVLAVYNHVQRTMDPRRKQGPWKPEEDKRLSDAVDAYGTKWQKVSEVVNRTASDCKDRYRNYVGIARTRRTGPWTEAEEAALKQAVREVQGNLEKTESKEIMWGAVAQKLGNTRSRQQCRAKWYDTHEREDAERDKWSKQDDFIFIQKLHKLKVKDSSEIDWKQLPDENWNKFRSHKLREHWRNFRKRVIESNPHIDKDDFRSVVNILKAEQDEKVDPEGNIIGKITKAGGAPKTRYNPQYKTPDIIPQDKLVTEEDLALVTQAV